MDRVSQPSNSAAELVESENLELPRLLVDTSPEETRQSIVTAAPLLVLVPPHERGFPSKGRSALSDAERRSRRREYSAHYRERTRTEAIAAYGGQCFCCGERHPRFLTFDHVNGGGNAHRREEPYANQLAAYLKSKGYPRDEYQLLCFNCNLGREKNGGVCPHQEHDIFEGIR